MNIENLIGKGSDLIVTSGGKILLALVIAILGRLFIRVLLRTLEKNRLFLSGDQTAKYFVLNSIKYALHVMLLISVIGVLGVPMASVVTVLASAGVAVGLALQGALSNLAGGIMIMLFRPFKVEDFVEAAGVSGFVMEVTLFYTTFITPDNKKIMVPNGTLMSANVINYSAEPYRRLDLRFSCGRDEDPAKVRNLIMDAVVRNEKVLSDPAPYVGMIGSTNEALEFEARIWCASEYYWDAHFEVMQGVTELFQKNAISSPMMRIRTEE